MEPAAAGLPSRRKRARTPQRNAPNDDQPTEPPHAESVENFLQQRRRVNAIDTTPKRRKRQEEEDARLARNLQRTINADQWEQIAPRSSRNRLHRDRQLAHRLQQEEEELAFFGFHPELVVPRRAPGASAHSRSSATRVAHTLGVPLHALDVDNMGYEELLALEEAMGSVSRGLSKGQLRSVTSVRQLAEKELASLQSTECSVCMCEFEVAEKVRTLPCLHMFHCHCVDRWFEAKRTCPICKADPTQLGHHSPRTSSRDSASSSSSGSASATSSTTITPLEFVDVED
eukprot:TRINITY_DN21469_c0_g1_i1.p1 TRINITY_DN21469_c0_g1~~TRINITY_DN21469_c0_g1_i1.p1  ORF type:complete len:314 (+),score=36.16 TRINITY_DN21469_c0_g1_i1:83-943(+)